MRMAQRTVSCLLAVLLSAPGCGHTRSRQTVPPPPQRAHDTRPAPPLKIEAGPQPAPAAPVAQNLELPPTVKTASPTPLPPAKPVGPPLDAPPPPVPAKPAFEPAPQDGLSQLRRLHRQAAERCASMDCYTVQMHRREQVRGKDGPEELVLFKFRRQPFSVHMKWIGKHAQGREAIYVEGQHEGKLHTLLAPGDGFLGFGGRQMALALDSPFVRNASRHPVTEAGVGNLVQRFGLLIDAAAKGDTRLGSLTYLAQQTRQEFSFPLEGYELVVPAGSEPDLPHGGRRLVLFDPTSHLPVLVRTADDHGHEIEYYLFENYQYPLTLTDADFDPNLLWPKGRR